MAIASRSICSGEWRAARQRADAAGSVMTTLTVLIVDDEPLARQRLQRLLRTDPDVRTAGRRAPMAARAVAAIHEQRPDLVFLDVQMPEMNGFEVLAAVGVKQMPAVIFVTAFDRFALQAFEARRAGLSTEAVRRRARAQVAWSARGPSWPVARAGSSSSS